MSSPKGQAYKDLFSASSGTSIGFYNADVSLFASYPSINKAALNLQADRKYISSCLNSGKLFRDRWEIRRMPSNGN